MSSPADLLRFAHQHVLTPGAARRAAISRAYYAAFHALQDAVDSMITNRGRHGCAHHGDLLSCLRQWSSKHPDQKKAMQFGADAIKSYHLLSACQEARELSDYQMGASGEMTPQEAVNIVGKADRLLKYAAKLSA